MMVLIKTGLIYFDQAIRHGSIRKAAETLNIASSAVNRQLLQLEEELDVQLFVRMPRGIRPTAAGEALLAYIRRWKRESVTLRHEMLRLRGGERGLIRIAAAESLADDLVPRAIARYKERFPLIEFSLLAGDNHRVKAELLSKEADVICAFDLTGTARTATVAHVQMPIGVIVPPGHPLSGLDQVTLSDCIPHAIVTPHDDWLKQSVLYDLFDMSEVPLKRVATVERIDTLKNLVRAGIGIAFLSRIGLERELAAGELHWIPLVEGIVRPASVSMLLQRGRVLPIYLSSFVDILKEEFARLEE
jgi:DNA-binding transcriptional LysR family regulator